MMYPKSSRTISTISTTDRSGHCHRLTALTLPAAYSTVTPKFYATYDQHFLYLSFDLNQMFVADTIAFIRSSDLLNKPFTFTTVEMRTDR